MTDTEVRTYKVEGMTCGHCKASVTEEVSQVAGVGSVEVDVEAGTLTVSGDAASDDIKAAVEEAGYRVTS